MGSISDLPASDPRRPDGFFETAAGGIDGERLACGTSRPTEPWERLRALAQVLLQGEDAAELTDMIFGEENATLERNLLKKDWQHHKGTWRNDHNERPQMNPADRMRYEREAHAARAGHPPMDLATARQIREDRKVHGLSYREIANKYGISPRQARSIGNGYTWRDEDHVA